MTEFEYIQAIELLTSRARENTIILMSAFSAYCLTSHFVGKQLPRLAAIGLSLLYSAFCLLVVSGMATAVMQFRAMVMRYLADYPDHIFQVELAPLGAIVAFMFTPYILGWLGSLIYMHSYVRKSKG